MRGKAWEGAFQFTVATSDLKGSDVLKAVLGGAGPREGGEGSPAADRTWETDFPVLCGGEHEEWEGCRSARGSGTPGQRGRGTGRSSHWPAGQRNT